MINFYTKGYYNEITVMKAMAAFFITWFHFKWTVPQEYANLFVGGVIGNSIFFYCSGYLLKFKGEKFKGEWFAKKLIRLLPSVWVFMLFVSVCDVFRGVTSRYAWFNWFYPTKYWFVNAIICFFMVAYLLKSYLQKGEICSAGRWSGRLKPRMLMLGCGVVLLYAVWYFAFVDVHGEIVMDEGGFKCWFYYFLFFLWGYYSKRKGFEVKGSFLSALCFPVSIILFYAYKKVAVHYGWMVEMQFVFVPVLLSLVVASSRNFAAWLFNKGLPQFLQKAFIFMSNLTLDIYIVQVYLITWLMPEMTFPLNVLVLFVLIALFAVVNKNVADKIGSFLTSKI